MAEKDQTTEQAEHSREPRGRIRQEEDGRVLIQSPFKLSYHTRLVVTFVLIALMTALIAAGILAVVWGNQFQSYARENMQRLADQTAVEVAEDYGRYGGFTDEVLSQLSESTSRSSEIAFQILDANGAVIYDDSWELSDSGVALAPPTKEQTATAPIVVGGETVGTVSVWSYGSATLLTQADLQFRDNSYRAIIIATLIAVMLAAFIGTFVARGLVNPIQRITRTAKEVKEGNLSARTDIRGTDEISQLGETFDEMADSIERDRELERRLTTDVAHELRTPLMGIQATTEAIMDGVFPADDERLAAINSETLRLKRLVDALLNLSKLESGSVPYNEVTLDLSELMRGICMSHEALLEDAGLKLMFEADEEVYVDGDPDMLRQAAANLISNAVRYNKPGGTVTLGVHKRGMQAALSVADTGIGLSDEDKEKIFSRFWRADAARNRSSGGLGVGLAVVKELVDYHGGEIEVESVLGEGTTFTLLFPLHTEPVEKHGSIFTTVIDTVSSFGRGDSGKMDKVAAKEARAAEKAEAAAAKAAEKEARDAEKSAERAAREEAREAERAAREAEKSAERAARAAEKEAREAERASRRRDHDETTARRMLLRSAGRTKDLVPYEPHEESGDSSRQG